MTSTHIVIFILVLLGNGVMALWKKHKDRQAQQAAAKLARSAGGAQAIDEKIAARQARRMEMRQPPVISPSQPPPVSVRTDVVAFEDVVRVEMRRLAAMQAVLNAAGSSAGAGSAGGSEAAGVPSAATEPAPIGGAATTARGRRLLGAMSLRNAILAREVLGPPRSARPWTGTTS